MVTYLVLFVIALGSSHLVMPMLARLSQRAKILDQPGERKIHVEAISRLGGAGVALALVIALGASVIIDAHGLTSPSPNAASLLPILAGAILVFAVGLWDDVSAVPPLRKLFVQVVAACFVVGSGLLITRVTVTGVTYELGILAYPLTLFWIVLITNAFNLIDGLDGLAGGLVVIAASACATVLIVRGEEPAALLLVSLVGATVGFLIHNFYPARIFLGDSGSFLSGFLLAVTAIIGRQKGTTTLATAVPLLIFALPLADTAVSIVRRLFHGGDFWRSPSLVLSRVMLADREHLHHRLLARGLSHRGTVLLLYVLASLCSVAALLMMERP
jgi:UDP-GlcNAc:undecaprenyl-phosphate GlcNAc-1-phosphate transferase